MDNFHNLSKEAEKTRGKSRRAESIWSSGKWSTIEDASLLQAFAQHPHDWKKISQSVASRSPLQCYRRYFDYLSPDLRRDEWSAEEDESLQIFVKQMGCMWRQIGRLLNRSESSTLNRFNHLQKQDPSQSPVKHPRESVVKVRWKKPELESFQIVVSQIADEYAIIGGQEYWLKVQDKMVEKGWKKRSTEAYRSKYSSLFNSILSISQIDEESTKYQE